MLDKIIKQYSTSAKLSERSNKLLTHFPDKYGFMVLDSEGFDISELGIIIYDKEQHNWRCTELLFKPTGNKKTYTVNKGHPNGDILLDIADMAKLILEMAENYLAIVFNGSVDFEKIEKFIFDTIPYYKNRKIQDFIDVWNLLGNQGSLPDNCIKYGIPCYRHVKHSALDDCKATMKLLANILKLHQNESDLLAIYRPNARYKLIAKEYMAGYVKNALENLSKDKSGNLSNFELKLNLGIQLINLKQSGITKYIGIKALSEMLKTEYNFREVGLVISAFIRHDKSWLFWLELPEYQKQISRYLQNTGIPKYQFNSFKVYSLFASWYANKYFAEATDEIDKNQQADLRKNAQYQEAIIQCEIFNSKLNS